jgi:molecular chaperone DnaK (HSP70)
MWRKYAYRTRLWHDQFRRGGVRWSARAIDPASRDPTVIRSTLYITREHQVFIGQEALATYYRQNAGRPSKMARRYVGEIEMTFAELPTFIKDVYVLVDEMTPGRLLRSLKSELASNYEGTTIFDRYYELEELLALYLREIRERVEAETGEAVDGVVLGRAGTGGGGAALRADGRRAAECRHF